MRVTEDGKITISKDEEDHLRACAKRTGWTLNEAFTFVFSREAARRVNDARARQRQLDNIGY